MSRSRHNATLDSDLETAIRQLVESDLTACGSESGLCRYCGALVEHYDEAKLEPHLPTCPWQTVRSHFFPTSALIKVPAKRAA